MQTMKKMALILSVAAIGAAFAPDARAQGHDLHYAQAGALLAYGQSELNLLYAALTAKEFDPKLTKDTVAELNRALVDAKKRVDRTIALLPESLGKQEPELEKLRTAIKKCEDTLNKLGNDIDEQTGGTSDEEEPELGARSEELDEAPPQRDWELLKRGTGWLGVDLAAARAQYGKLARRLKLRSMKKPPKPRGKRPE